MGKREIKIQDQKPAVAVSQPNLNSTAGFKPKNADNSMNFTLYNNLEKHIKQLNNSSEISSNLSFTHDNPQILAYDNNDSFTYNDMAVIVESDKDSFWDQESSSRLPATGKSKSSMKVIRTATKEKLTRNKTSQNAPLIHIRSNNSLKTEVLRNDTKQPRYFKNPNDQYVSINSKSKPPTASGTYVGMNKDLDLSMDYLGTRKKFIKKKRIAAFGNSSSKEIINRTFQYL